jgi:hypothetical protein
LRLLGVESSPRGSAPKELENHNLVLKPTPRDMIEDGRSSMFWHDKIQLAISLKCVKHVNDDPLRTSSRLQHCNTLLRSFHFRLRQRSDCRSVPRRLAGVHDKTRHILLSAHRSISDLSCMFHTSSMGICHPICKCQVSRTRWCDEQLARSGRINTNAGRTRKQQLPGSPWNVPKFQISRYWSKQIKHS